MRIPDPNLLALNAAIEAARAGEHGKGFAVVGEHDTQDVGVMVDAVNAVLEIPPQEIEPPPSFGANIRADFMSGMGKVNGKFVIILNIQHVLSVDEMATLSEIEANDSVASA